MGNKFVVTFMAAIALFAFASLRAEQAETKEAHPANKAEQKVNKPAGTAARPNALNFKEADADGDGFLSLEEFKLMQTKRQEALKARMGDRYDPERFGKSTADEDFAKLDKDNNGKVSEEEYKNGQRELMRGRQRTRGANAPQKPAAPAQEAVETN